MAIKKSVKRRVKKHARKTGKRVRGNKRMVKGGNPLTTEEIEEIIEKVVGEYGTHSAEPEKENVVANKKEEMRKRMGELSMDGAYNYEYKDPESDVVRDNKGKLISRGEDTLKARAEDLAISVWKN